MRTKRAVAALVLTLSFVGIQRSEAGGPFGLGAIAGEPTGISMKLWTSQRTALDAVVAYSFDDAMHLHADYLWHFYDRLVVEEGSLPLYIGLGGRMQVHEGHTDEGLGVRMPLGLSYLFAEAPLDLFLEIAPVMNLAPETDLDAEGGIGLRYVFGRGR